MYFEVALLAGGIVVVVESLVLVVVLLVGGSVTVVLEFKMQEIFADTIFLSSCRTLSSIFSEGHTLLVSLLTIKGVTVL